MRFVLSFSLLCAFGLMGCGAPEPEPIEGVDTAEELTEEQETTERELTNDTGEIDENAL